MKLGIISDIHANLDALDSALKVLEEENIDQYIFLGDLLSYGTQPNEVVHTLVEFSKKKQCIFLRGNHDQFYFDLEEEKNLFTYPVADFVKESVLWTANKLQYSLKKEFLWQENYKIKNLYFSHANPFQTDDWSYLATRKDFIKACQALASEKINIALFGHTHRCKLYKFLGEDIEEISTKNIQIEKDKFGLIGTLSALGQPRGDSGAYVYIIEENEGMLTLTSKEVKVDWENVIRGFSNTTLSFDTKKRLIKYYEQNI